MDNAGSGAMKRSTMTNGAPLAQSVSNGTSRASLSLKSTSKVDGRNSIIRDGSSDDRRQKAVAIAYSTIPEWANTLAMVSLIFGGCCSNVYALEAIIQQSPGQGTLITCFQFVLTTLFTASSHVDIHRGWRNCYLKPRAIPFQRWLTYTAFFLTVNMLNNKAFDYRISVPLHIILRSAGPVTTMVVGRLAGRRYPRVRVVAVVLLFGGVVQAALADAMAKKREEGVTETVMQAENVPTTTMAEFVMGFGLLYLALVLSAVMGVYTDQTYAKYGRTHVEENLFYSHMLSLPFFLLSAPELRGQTRELLLSPPSTVFISGVAQQGQVPGLLHAILQRLPSQAVFLVINGLTQYLCIRGVNQLSARSSSLTVGIVLNIRKLVSLLLSIWLFGNKLAPGVLIGAAVVFVGGGLYAMPAKSPDPTKVSQERKRL